MKKSDINQLELPILMDVSFSKARTVNGCTIESCVPQKNSFIESAQVAGKEDIDVYLSICNEYYKAISSRKG